MTGALAFLSPWMLFGLALLPVIWLLLRLTPPRPASLVFPPTRLLLGLEEADRTPARTPWWLTLLRLMIAALLILALAEPVLRPEARLAAGGGPLLVVLDNGWDTGPDFALRRAMAEAAIAEARRTGQPVGLFATAEAAAQAPEPGAATDALDRLALIEPRPYPADRAAAAERVANAYTEGSADVVWIAGPLDNGDAGTLAAALTRVARSSALVAGARGLTVMRPPQNAVDRARVPLQRIGGAGAATVAGFDEEGRRIVDANASFGLTGEAVAEIAMPAELRNALTRFAVEDEASAGAVQLLDAGWRRKAVGLIAGEAGDAPQPLLAPLTYVERALSPQVDLIVPEAASTGEAVKQLVQRRASVIVLTATGNLPADVTQALEGWIKDGGTLVRFASPNLAATESALLPVRLREGERALGGSLSWETPQAIGAFSPDGPFARIPVPQDVAVSRQILADPEALGQAQVWAELADGTPLVTAAGRGAGRIVLFHVTADPRWSNLPLSGAFVEMLTAIVESATALGTAAPETASGAAGAADAPEAASAPWRPVRVLDGYGRLQDPDAAATLVANISAARPSAATPPGLYERNGATRALNAVTADTPLVPLDVGRLGWTGETLSLAPQASRPLWPWLLALAALLAAADAVAVLALSGRLVPARARAAAVLLFSAMLVAPAGTPRAQDAPAAPAVREAAPATEADGGGDVARMMEAALVTRLAYVVTGDAAVDETSRAGMEGLTRYLASRTALEPGEPMGLDLETDELTFHALIYWPVVANAEPPSPAVMAKVDAFLKNGGTILFDTRDAGGMAMPGTLATPETEALRAILASIDVPPLEPVPPDHVLTKAFYLLREFPGRWRDSDLWVESLGDAPQNPDRPARGGDGVSPILITGNDFAAAWAVDPEGRYLYPTVPADPRQREFAYRAGVNIVMYTLTGNYKTDQVHVPALLERLGQ